MDAKQLNCIEMMVLYPNMTQKDIAKEIQVSENTIVTWKKSPEFQAELKNRLDEEWKSYRKEAQQAMLKLMRDGNYQATQYILDSNGLKATEKIEATVTPYEWEER